MAEVPVNQDDAFLELCQLLRQARKIIEDERQVTFTSYEVRGVVRDDYARHELAKYDRWLKRAKRVLPS